MVFLWFLLKFYILSGLHFKTNVTIERMTCIVFNNKMTLIPSKDLYQHERQPSLIRIVLTISCLDQIFTRYYVLNLICLEKTIQEIICEDFFG